MSAREELRAIATYLEQRSPLVRDGAGSRHAAALRALADRIDEEFARAGHSVGIYSGPAARSLLVRLDADLAPPQKDPR